MAIDIAFEPVNRQILALFYLINPKRKHVVAERIIGGLVKRHGQHPISADGGTWYPQACKFLKLDHHIHSFLATKRKA